MVVGLVGKTVDTFDAGMQGMLASALAGYVGVDVGDVSLIGIASSGKTGVDIEIRVELLDPTGNASMSGLATQLGEGISSGVVSSTLVGNGLLVQLEILAGPVGFGDTPPPEQ
eukprot:620910-Rhodomonas_salina.1